MFERIKAVSYNLISNKIREKKNTRLIARKKAQGNAVCIVQRGPAHYKEGLFASYLAIIKMIHIALNEGFTPVVDMKTYKNPYLRDNEVGVVNSWEFFFEQPCKISMDSVDLNNSIMIDEPFYASFPDDTMEFLTNASEVAYWREFSKKYIRFSDEFTRYYKMFEEIERKIKSNRVLGVYLRGTDYISIEPIGHCRVPSIQESIAKTEEMVNKGEYKYIFLSAEDETFYNAFKKYFGDKIITIEQKRYNDISKNGIMMTDSFINSDIKKVGMDYLAAVYLISQCTSLFAARCCGAIGALLFSDGFEEIAYWNNGRYKKDHYNQNEGVKTMAELVKKCI